MHISTPMTAERLKRVKEIDPSKIAVLDTETTGLDPKNDEVLSLSIVDGAGEMLFDSLIRPSRRKRWPKAQEIHGISPADVADAPTLAEVSDEVRGILRDADLVVGYNVEFDLGMLEAGGLDLYFPTFCVMKEFAPVNGRWSEKRGDYAWCKLAQCAKHYGYGPFAAHGSLEDAKATAHCFRELTKDPAYASAVESRDDVRERAERATKGADSCLFGCLFLFAAVFVVLLSTIWSFFS